MIARMSKQEREKARRRWLQPEEYRKWAEARNKQLLAEIAETEVRNGKIKMFGQWVPKDPRVVASPAFAFLVKRRIESPPGDPTTGNRAIIDLVASDIPLDPFVRSIIAGTLHRLSFPNAERDRREMERYNLSTFKMTKHHYMEHRGMTADEADHAVLAELGELLGIKTVGALKQRRKRARRRGTKI
jgi:hypothetical protein